MLLSMTGYGKARGEYNGRSYVIDIKSLNGKTADLRLKVPLFLRSKEIELRKQVLQLTIRGKMDLSIIATSSDNAIDFKLNTNLIESYIKSLSTLADRHNLVNQDLLQTIIRIPNVVEPNTDDVSPEEWAFIQDRLNDALSELKGFRAKEGKVLADDLISRAAIDQVQTCSNCRT